MGTTFDFNETMLDMVTKQTKRKFFSLRQTISHQMLIAKCYNYLEMITAV